MADKTTQRSFDKEYLEQRINSLQIFIDSLAESEVIRSSIHFLCFLKCSDDNQWTKIKEELEKTLKKSSVKSNSNSGTFIQFLKKNIRRKKWIKGGRF